MSDVPAVVVDAITAQLVEAKPNLADVEPREVVAFVADRIVGAMEVAGGDPLGMIRRSDAGIVATRVMHGVIPAWQIVDTDGISYDTQATLDWPAIYTPDGAQNG